jgi:hypothetical protein
MKKILLLASIVVGLLAANAGAITYTTYTDTNSGDVYFNGLFGVNSHTDSFNITNHGYDHATEHVYSATAEFRFEDNFGFSESLSVVLGGSPFEQTGSFSNWITLSDSVVGSALFDLSADGIVSYTITRTDGEFYLRNATLTAVAGSNSVPDGGTTLALLGMSVIGVFGFQRKFALSR